MKATFLTTPELIGQHWWAVASLIDLSVSELSRGEWTTEDLARLVEEGRAFAVLVERGDQPLLAMIFEFRHYPRRTSCNIMALAGRDLASVAVTFWPTFRQWVQESGATHIEACAGPAMTRVLSGLGFVHIYNLIKMEA